VKSVHYEISIHNLLSVTCPLCCHTLWRKHTIFQKTYIEDWFVCTHKIHNWSLIWVRYLSKGEHKISNMVLQTSNNFLSKFFFQTKKDFMLKSGNWNTESFNPLNAELNPICYLLALLGAQNFLHVSRIRVKLLTLRRLMPYIYICGAPILDISRSHTMTQHSR